MNGALDLEWIADLRSALTVADERVPLERALRPYWGSIGELRARNLTWFSIANLLARHGVVRRSGVPISGDQLRAIERRSRQAGGLERRASNVVPRPMKSNSSAGRPLASTDATPPARREATSLPPQERVTSSKEVSAEEIAIALKVLNNPNV